MAGSFPEPGKPSSSALFNAACRPQDDTVFYAIFPDDPSSLHTLHLRILETLAPFTSGYIWQHEPFSLSPSAAAAAAVPHLRGKLRFGDNLADEWFVVFLLIEASRAFPDVSVRVWDSDGEFLLIEAAHHLPRWLDPDTSLNRVFLRRGDLHIVPRDLLPSPSLEDSLRFLASAEAAARAPEAVQAAIRRRVSEYPEKARRDMHRVRVRVPVAVAAVLSREPCLISLAVEGFYDRDVDSMNSADKMETFLPPAATEEELVTVSVKMSRAMYAQLAGQAFRAPRRYPMPRRSGVSAEELAEAELGMKIACGLEMAYQQRKKDGSDGKGGGAWDVFRESLERSGFFGDLLPGSQEHRRLMKTAEDCYRNTSAFSAASEIMNAPVKRIDEILAMSYSAEEFKGVEVPLSDDDSWLYDGEADLNSALSERQKELDLYNVKREKRKKKLKLQQDGSESSSMNVDDEVDPSEIVKTMRAFVSKVSSYKGAEVPEDRNMKEVDLDVERFFKDMESIMNHRDYKDIASDDDEAEGGSSSDMDFEDSEEDESDGEEEKDAFMQSYSDALNEELKGTSLPKSFLRAKEQASAQDECKPSSSTTTMDEDFSPVDADVNLVKSLLDSFASQEGLSGPASNLLGLMGLQLQDPKKDKSK